MRRSVAAVSLLATTVSLEPESAGPSRSLRVCTVIFMEGISLEIREYAPLERINVTVIFKLQMLKNVRFLLIIYPFISMFSQILHFADFVI